MPGKKQHQRTKGNLRPSSSSHAAELLNSSGSAGTGFIGFGQAPKYVPASSSLEDMDTSLDADFRLTLRKLTKRDATTKVKACQEFADLCREKSDDCLKCVLPFWPRTFNKLVMDLDYRVREATQQSMAVLAGRVGRNLAPYLKKLMGAWLLAQSDTYPTVSSSAQMSFQAAFPPVKQVEAIVYCKDEILEFLKENLVKHTPSTLSDPKQTEQEDMENKYNRVMASSFLALRKLLTNMSREDLESLETALSSLLSDPKLWKHGKSKITMVRSGMYSFLAGLCQTQLDLLTQFVDKMTPFILHNLDEKDPAICSPLWEAILSLVNFVPECWRYVNIQKAFWPKLKNLLENGCHGNAVIIGPNLLPTLSKIPSDVFPDHNKFMEDFFFYFRKGIGSPSALKSSSECGALIRAYMECVHLVVKQQTDTPLLSLILMDQVLPVVQASLLEPSILLSSSPLYGMLGKVLTGLESNEQSAHTVSMFWTSLNETTENRLSNTEAQSDGFEKRIVHLVKCLYFPDTETKTKSRKVGFEADTKDISGVEKKMVTNSSSLTKAEIGMHGKKFVHNLIILTFKLAHKHSSFKYLQMLAELLELDSSDEILSKVIDSCHGDVSSDRPLQYFVFEICIPWLTEIQQGSECGEALIHLIHVVCLFIPSLEMESNGSLLNQLYEICLDSTSQKVLIQKLFNMATNCPSVKIWLQGSTFGEKWVERSRSLTQMTFGPECHVVIDNTFEILTEILRAREYEGEEPLVKGEYLMKVLEGLTCILDRLDNTDRHDNSDTVTQFVSQCVLLYFTEYKDSIQSEVGCKVIKRLYEICLVNSYGIKDDSMKLCQSAWSVGITNTVQMTGGLLYDTSILKHITQTTVSTLTTSVTTSDKLFILFENVKVLLDSVQTGLPDMDRDNVVYKSICSHLTAEVPVCIPKKMLEYQSLKGEYPGIPESEHKFQIQTLFISLYNCKLLQHILMVETDNGVGTVAISAGRWTDECLENFLTCVLGHTIVQTMVKVDTIIGKLSEIHQSSEDLSKLITELSNSLGKHGMERLWKLAFEKSEDNVHYVSCLSTVLTLMKDVWPEEETLSLQLDPLMQRHSSTSRGTVKMLGSTVDYLSSGDQLTLAEILVARILTLSADSIFDEHDVISLMSVISKLTQNIVETHKEEVIQLLIGVLDQILVWKDQIADVLANSCSPQGNLFNVEVSRFLGCVVVQIPANLTDKHWDFIMCALVSWIQELKDIEGDILSSQSPGLQCLLVSVLDLVSKVSVCLKVNVEANQGSYPPELKTEWLEFFGESIFSNLLPFYVNFNKTMQQRAISGTDRIVLASVCDATSKAPPTFVTNHELPPLLIADDTSPLPDNLQTLMNHMCPLLLARDCSAQLSAFEILNSIIDTMPSYDKEDKSIILEASGGEEKDEETKRSPPPHLLRIIDKCQLVLEEFLVDVHVDELQTVIADTLQFQHTFGYLLSWRLLLQFFHSAPSELRQEYAVHLKELGYVKHLMNNLFKLMPKTNRKMFETPFSPSIKGESSSLELQHMTCDLYLLVLKTIPAMARQWWKDQDRKTSAYVDSFTTKFVSMALCSAELQTVQARDTNMDDMKIRTRSTAREVIATYGIEEVSVEIVITLPVNYPLGNITVTSEKRVGVSGAQWERWLLQLNIFLTHQNGNIVDGLKLWRDNISKKFEGVEECMICFYVLHGTNFQLPRITCRTCKKKFHSACLYKWFNTSHNCTCPLCRNIF